MDLGTSLADQEGECCLGEDLLELHPLTGSLAEGQVGFWATRLTRCGPRRVRRLLGSTASGYHLIATRRAKR